jgi:hypothetical protein
MQLLKIKHGFSDAKNRTFYLLTTSSKWKFASSENQTLLNDFDPTQQMPSFDVCFEL